MNATTLLPLTLFTNWLATGERGLSSEAIVSRLTGVQLDRWGIGGHYPHDPSDFRRCERLLRQVPLARLAFGSMRDVSDVWARLVDAWDELVALIEEEVSGAFDGPLKWNSSAPLAYARIKELTEATS